MTRGEAVNCWLTCLVLVGIVIQILHDEPAHGPGAVSMASDRNAESLKLSLQELRQEVVEMLRRDLAERSLERTHVVGDAKQEALAANIERSEELLEQHANLLGIAEQRGRRLLYSSPNQLLQERRAIAWTEWERLGAMPASEARASLLLATPAEVVALLGPPTRIDVSGDYVCWSYDRPAAISPSGKLQIGMVRFVDGGVIEFQALEE